MTIVEAERACCPFLSIHVDEADEVLTVDVSAPPEAAPVVDDLLRSFHGGRIES